MMMMIKLTFNATTTPDFSGFSFYVEAGRFFDVDDYAEAYGINSDDIDVLSIHNVQDAAVQLQHGEWLEVTHEVVE